MRIAAVVLATSLSCSSVSAMWWNRPKPAKAPSAGAQILQKLEMCAVIAAFAYFLLADDGIIAQWTEPSFPNLDEEL